MSEDATLIKASLADWASRDRAAALRLFVPAARTLAASSRIALGHALRESVWMGSDARVSEAKSAWWLEELALAERGQPRHPLTSFLAQQAESPNFAQLSRELTRLRASSPDDEAGGVLAALGDLERQLWFGASSPNPAACATRARAAWVDVLQRRGRFELRDQQNSAARSAVLFHSTALLAAPASDGWTAARRAQALSWIEVRDGRMADGRAARLREVWVVWRAVQAARWHGPE